MSNEIPTCLNCQKKYWGACLMGSRTCYVCGQEGHQVKDYPKKNRAQRVGTSASASIQQPLAGRRDNQLRYGRAFALVPGNTLATTSIVLGILLICCQPTHVFIDSGSTHSFVSYLFAHYLHMSSVPLDYILLVSLSSGDSIICDKVIILVKLLSIMYLCS